MPIKVGVTGGIGAGKSVVTGIFSTLGIPVYDSDSKAKSLMITNDELRRAISKQFGDQAYEQGKLNRRYLAKQVFGDKSKIEALNNLVHPAVAKDFEQWLNRHTTKSYIIKEAALLIESGSYKTLDRLILVEAPDEIRLERVLRRDPQRSKEEVLAIMKKQLSTSEKKQFAHEIILNDGMSSLIRQVVRIHNNLSVNMQA